ncbi:MAG: urate hydroxylase PuuD [Rhizomicrobium sp.]
MDRPALVLQLRRHPDDAENPRRAEAGARQVHHAGALFWFRWGAMGTIVFGIILAGMNHYLIQAYTLDIVGDPTGAFSTPSYLLIGIGMWLGTIMWFNVWFVIWPNQQKALNIENRYPDLAAPDKAASARTAGQFSRINTMLSIPMLFCMAAASHLP